MTEQMAEQAFETITLHLDNGSEMQFSGKQFAGGSWYDEESGELTRQNLYVTDKNEHVYAISKGLGTSRERRAYRVSLEGESCVVNDGRTTMTVELEALMMAVRALTGLDRDAVPTLEMVEETLRAANC